MVDSQKTAAAHAHWNKRHSRPLNLQEETLNVDVGAEVDERLSYVSACLSCAPHHLAVALHRHRDRAPPYPPPDDP